MVAGERSRPVKTPHRVGEYCRNLEKSNGSLFRSEDRGNI
jgi:hypothetical protein